MPSAMREGGRLLVVGGVAAGMSAASKARRLRPDVEIVVLERTRDVSYAACMLPYFVSGLVGERDKLVKYDADFFRTERGIDVRLETEAVGLDPKGRTVTCRKLSGGEEVLEYDAAVIATGAVAFKPPLPGIDLPGVETLKTFADGDRLKERVDSGGVRKAAIVGAGYVGLEMAEALVERGIEVTVIELLPTVFSTLDPDISEVVERELLDKGVILRKETAVEGFEPRDGSESVGYVVASGQRLETDLALVAIGVRPSVGLAKDAGLELGKTGAIKVDARQVTSEPSVLAAGDCCEAQHLVTGRPAWIPLGTTANKQGKIAGENAVGGSVKFGGIVGTNLAKVFDLEIAQTGLSERAAGKEGLKAGSASIVSKSRHGAYPGASPVRVKLVFERGSGRLLGGQMVGKDGVAKRIDSIATALHARMTVEDLAGIDMGYAPPFSPVWDPVLMAALQATKKVGA